MTTYKKSGVDIKLSDKFTEFLEKKSKAIGGFAGLLPISETGEKPRPLELKKGVVLFTLMVKEPGVRADQFLLTNDAEKRPAGAYKPSPNALVEDAKPAK